MKINDRGWLSEDSIKSVETAYNAKYCLFTEVNIFGKITNDGVHVFYVENPDESKGHTHYFYLRQNMAEWVVGAFEWEQTSIEGVDVNGEFWYSSTVHDYVQTPIGVAIDGGRCYTRLVGSVDKSKLKTIIFTEDGMKFKEN